MTAHRLQAFLMLLLVVTGCQRSSKIHEEYGQRRGKSMGKSVNGTGVLARIFESKGYRVRTTSRLGRIVERSDVVVWFPDRYRPPDPKSRDFFEDWLQESPGRTLVIVGRDYDASLAYWEKSLKVAPASERLETRRRLARNKTKFARQRSGYLETEDCRWFALDRAGAPERVTSLEGPWSHGIDASQVEMQLATRIQPSEDAEQVNEHGSSFFRSLLTSNDDALIAEYANDRWGGSRILVIANGSWLLNLSLLNHEHRKLACRLVDECGNAPERAVFLESGPGGPTLATNEPNRHHGLTAFTVWPVNCILIHLCMLGTILCFSVFPIFGRPKEWQDDIRSDFGKHIEALGQLMFRTADREYAQQRRQHFLQRVAKESQRESASLPTDRVDPTEPSKQVISESEVPPPPPSSDNMAKTAEN